MELNLDFRGFEVVYDLAFHKRLFETLERELKEVNRKTIDEIRNGTVVEDADDHGLLSSTLHGMEDDALNQQQTLRSTQIIRLYVLFEGHLKSMCQIIRGTCGLKLSLSDLRGGLVERGQLFLCDYSGVISKSHPVWPRIALLNKLRNYLVHASVDAGNKEKTAELVKVSRSCHQFQLLEEGQLNLSKEFCDYLHEGVKDLFSLLFDALGWRAFKQ